MNLKLLRKQYNKTQEEIAKDLHLQKQTYQNYELGKREPDIKTLIKLANYFDVSLDFLCDRPRPYDLPSTTTKDQKEAINLILQLNSINTIKAVSYCAGLLANQN